jgi:hypothetical protein
MPQLSSSQVAREFLNQFRPDDRDLARELIDTVKLVSNGELVSAIREMVLQRAQEGPTPVGLYAEREVRKWRGRPNRLFEEKVRRGVRRAEGIGPLAVSPIFRYAQFVGSEGLIAHLITQLVQEHPSLFLSHPGPDSIRSEKVRRFFLLTDFIGSGARVTNYLNSAWRIASVRSWWSLRRLRFQVLAYSATDAGAQLVRNHRCRPVVTFAAPCRTIDNSFSPTRAAQLRALCVNYDPLGPDPVASLGYCGTGALLAFFHGAPNNSPRLLYSTNKQGSWTPLFPKRVTAALSEDFFVRPLSVEAVAESLRAMRQEALANSPTVAAASEEGQRLYMVLAAAAKGPRTEMAVAGKTGLRAADVSLLAGRLVALGWLTPSWEVTAAGYAQLTHARTVAREPHNDAKALDDAEKPFYYPQSLRPPV